MRSLLLALLCANCGGTAAVQVDREPTPVILFLVDTLRADHLGCYGYDENTSPALDALAADGVLFKKCQAQSSWTKPATASILTGLLPSVHNAVHKVSALPTEHMLLAEPLLRAGYRTGAFGSNGFIFGPEHGFTRGFETFRSGHELFEDPSHFQIADAEMLVDAGLDWLDTELSKSDDEQVFLYVHAVDPHDPYAPPEDLVNKFGAQLPDGLPTDAELARPAPILARYPGGVPDQVLGRMVNLYDAEIFAADRALGRLVDGLKQRGIYDKAMIVFVSDHGEEFLDHGGVGHNPKLFQEVIHVPLVIKFPQQFGSQFQNRRFVPTVRQVDVLPTILDVAGVELAPERHSQLAGLSILEALSDNGDALEDWLLEPAVTEVDYEGVYRKSLIQGQYKYIRSWAPDQSEQLYDLDEDPLEKRNLAGEEEQLLAQLRMDLGRVAAVGQRGFGLTLSNGMSETVQITGLFTYEGEAFDGLDPKHMEIDGHGGRAVDGPLGQGWVQIEELPTGGSQVRYGMGPTLEQADLQVSAELNLKGAKNYSGRGAWFFTVLEPGDRDDVLFAPSKGTLQPELQLWANGLPVPPEYFLLGPEMLRADSSPLLIQADANLEMGTEPDTRAAPKELPLFAWLWKNVDPGTIEIELSPAAEANLRALGYLGD